MENKNIDVEKIISDSPILVRCQIESIKMVENRMKTIEDLNIQLYGSLKIYVNACIYIYFSERKTTAGNYGW